MARALNYKLYLASNKIRHLLYYAVCLILVSVMFTGLFIQKSGFNIHENYIKFIFFVGLLLFPLYGFIRATRLKLRIALLDPRFAFVLPYVLYFGFAAIDLTDYEIKSSIGQYFYYYWGIIWFLVGTFLVGFNNEKIYSKIKQEYEKANTVYVNHFSQIRLMLCIVGLFLIALVAYYKIAGVGLPMLSASVQASRGKMVGAVSGYIYYLGFLPVDIIILIGFYRIVEKRPLFILSFLDYGLILMGCMMLFLLGSRSRLITPFFVLLIIYAMTHWESVLNWKVLLAVLVIGVFIVATGAYRYSLDAKCTYFDAFMHTLFGEMNLSSSTFERLLQFFPRKVDFIGIKAFVMPFIAILPGRQEVLTSLLKEDLNLKMTGGGFTPTLIGDFYLVGGVKVIVIGMMIYGAALMRFYKRALLTFSPGNILCFAFAYVYALNTLKKGFLIDLEPVFHGCALLCIYMVSTKGIKKTRMRVPERE